jgi:hypothetical protein
MRRWHVVHCQHANWFVVRSKPMRAIWCHLGVTTHMHTCMLTNGRWRCTDEVSNQYAFTYAKLASQRSFEQESTIQHMAKVRSHHPPAAGFHSQYLSIRRVQCSTSSIMHCLCLSPLQNIQRLPLRAAPTQAYRHVGKEKYCFIYLENRFKATTCQPSAKGHLDGLN